MTNDPGPLCLGMALSVSFSIFTFYLPALMFSLYQSYKLKSYTFKEPQTLSSNQKKTKTEQNIFPLRDGMKKLQTSQPQTINIIKQEKHMSTSFLSLKSKYRGQIHYTVPLCVQPICLFVLNLCLTVILLKPDEFYSLVKPQNKH